MRSALLALFLLGALGYYSALTNPFVHDDVVFILQNPKVHTLSGIGEVFNKSSFAPQNISVANSYYRPFLDIVYRLEYAVFGANPLGYHLLNIVLHFVNAVLLFKLTLCLSRRENFSWVAAVVFLIAPVQSEAVACISGISNLLFVFFLLAAFLFYTKIADQNRPLRLAYEAAIYSGSLFFFGCALLSKEQAIILPILLLAYEFCFPKIAAQGNSGWRLRLAGFLIITGGYLLWRRIVIGAAINPFVSNWGEFYLRLKSLPGMILNHLQSVFWPYNLHYYRSYDILTPWVWPAVSFFLVGVICILIWQVLPKNRRPMYGFGLGWFFVTLLPTTSIIPLVHEYSLIALFEHFLYLPLAGLLWSVLIALDYFSDQIFHRNSIVVKKVFIMAVIVNGILLTQAQTRMWAGEIPLFEKAVKYENTMGRLHLLLAGAYYTGGYFKQAQQEYEIGRDIMNYYLSKIRDQRVRPFYQGFLKDSLLGIASCQQALGHWQAAQREYERILLFSLPDSSIENNLGVCAVHAGNLKQAKTYFYHALEMDPNLIQARKNLEELEKQTQDKQ